MKRLERLPQIASRQLGGLEADSTLWAKARLQAAQAHSRPAGRTMLRPALAMCAALVVLIGAVAAMDGGVDVPQLLPQQNVLDSHSAGTQSQPTQEPAALGDVPAGSISMSAGVRRRAQTLFEENTGASFPLITLKDATYRMLAAPAGISSALLGSELGRVSEFNIEPALGSGGVVSNVVSLDEPVYAIDGMDGALVCASVNGSLRVFQRVSYAGTAIIGRETLGNTLCASGQVEWIEVDGMGRLEGDKARQAMQVLLDYADYQGTALSGSGSMQVGLVNGLTLQLMTGEDTVSACGTWSCPDFFETFAQAQKSE